MVDSRQNLVWQHHMREMNYTEHICELHVVRLKSTANGCCGAGSLVVCGQEASSGSWLVW
jgi:hypothetical protein